jgi:hypothetical protein
MEESEGEDKECQQLRADRRFMRSNAYISQVIQDAQKCPANQLETIFWFPGSRGHAHVSFDVMGCSHQVSANMARIFVFREGSNLQISLYKRKNL